ncbi:MAG: 4'-phosphopantetheinyl transferase superfamily protein [bacterium]
MIYYCYITPQWLRLFDKDFNITNQRKTKINNYIKLEDKLNSLVSFLLIKKYFEVNNIKSDLNFIYNEHGKPFINNCPVKFNISHTDNMVVVAFSEYEIGVDVEKVNEFSENLVSYIFDEIEIKEYSDLLTDLVFLTNVWTKREAYLKMVGTGISSDFNNIKFDYKKLSLCYNGFMISSAELDNHIISISSNDKSYELKEISLEDILEIS